MESMEGISPSGEKLEDHEPFTGHSCSASIVRSRQCWLHSRHWQNSVFHKVLLQEGVEHLLAGDIDTVKAVLREYIKATIGFAELSRVFDKSNKNLMHMFGPKVNPQASNLFAVIHYLQEQEGIHLEIKARKVARDEWLLT